MSISRLAVTLLSLVALGGCTYASGFRGPGYDPKSGVTLDGTDRVVVALTKAVLRDDREGSSDFWTHVFKVEDTLADRPGFIGYALRTELFGPRAWTMTVWRDEVSLDAFVQSDAHQTAIREALASLKVVRFARFEAGREDVPISWERAVGILETEGRGYE